MKGQMSGEAKHNNKKDSKKNFLIDSDIQIPAKNVFKSEPKFKLNFTKNSNND